MSCFWILVFLITVVATCAAVSPSKTGAVCRWIGWRLVRWGDRLDKSDDK